SPLLLRATTCFYLTLQLADFPRHGLDCAFRPLQLDFQPWLCGFSGVILPVTKEPLGQTLDDFVAFFVPPALDFLTLRNQLRLKGLALFNGCKDSFPPFQCLFLFSKFIPN